ncbi:hypothetical protein BD769DRAFT_1666544 [Suillus cothurnatus]|nr:hypothetical protein BD769DRAFT_1666544 [Suillus cothurnatus]
MIFTPAVSTTTDSAFFYRVKSSLWPLGHSLKLAIGLRDRFYQRGILSDAFELHRAALLLHPLVIFFDLGLPKILPSACIPYSSSGGSCRWAIVLHCPSRRPVRSTYPGNITISFRDRFKQRAILDLITAKWATSFDETKRGSASVAYQTALQFLDQHVVLLSFASLYVDIIRGTTSSPVMDALLYGARHGTVKTAMELVEQGLAVF